MTRARTFPKSGMDRAVQSKQVTTERKGGRRYRQFRARILLRDPVCTQPSCRARSAELHHDPPLVLVVESCIPTTPSACASTATSG